MKSDRLRFASRTLFAIVLASLLGTILLQSLLTDVERHKVVARQRYAAPLEVELCKTTSGFFIDGGHAWSIGSTKDSYELRFRIQEREVQWQGPGTPIILQLKDKVHYLATFDRETDLSHTVFRCYAWDGDWVAIPQDTFPKDLAISNLYLFDAEGDTSLGGKDFRFSLLARFWHCISYGEPYWKLTDSMITDAFVSEYQKRWIALERP